VPICLVQSYIYVNSFILSRHTTGALYLPGWDNFFDIMTAVFIMTCGTMFLMWIGEQIDEYGIGNGISLIIMAGIVSRLPEAFKRLFFIDNGAKFNYSIFQIGGAKCDRVVRNAHFGYMEIAELTLHAQTMFAQSGQVRASRDKTHIASAVSEPRAEIAAHASGADDCDSHSLSLEFPCAEKFTAFL